MISALDSIPEPQNFAPSPDFKWLCEELFVKIHEVQIHERPALANQGLSSTMK